MSLARMFLEDGWASSVSPEDRTETFWNNETKKIVVPSSCVTWKKLPDTIEQAGRPVEYMALNGFSCGQTDDGDEWLEDSTIRVLVKKQQ